MYDINLEQIKSLAKQGDCQAILAYCSSINETYWELYTMQRNGSVGYYAYFTGTEVDQKNILHEVENYKNGEYYGKFGHYKQISETEYKKKVNYRLPESQQN